MPDVAEHIAQAHHNERFFATIDPAQYSDWAVTVLFYSALHYIDAYLATTGYLDPGTHPERLRLIRSNAVTRAVYREYSRLKNYSENARYYGARFTPIDVRGLNLGDLDRIRRQITAQLP